jgi:hypothetical protein
MKIRRQFYDQQQFSVVDAHTLLWCNLGALLFVMAMMMLSAAGFIPLNIKCSLKDCRKPHQAIRVNILWPLIALNSKCPNIFQRKVSRKKTPEW